MSSIANILIHASQFPASVRRDLRVSLRTRKINHKFHYDSVKQTQKWLALHQMYSPSRNDADCAATYDRAFAGAVKIITSKSVRVIGLGCGGGQKDVRLLKLLKSGGVEIFYAPCDVSTAMVLVARQAAGSVLPEKNCFPVVCDLATVENVSGLFAANAGTRTPRLITFFGMIPNFEPQMILPKLASLMRSNDFLLFSANLAPGKNYAAGVGKVLPQYDNLPTREWLMTFLLDFGVAWGDGDLSFKVENGTAGLKRIVAHFCFKRARRLELESEKFNFRRGESIRLFFSYRYTPGLVLKTLAAQGLEILDQWITKSGEEGVFLCRKSRRVGAVAPLRSKT